jgi:Domain of unknown function (DUF1839)
MGVTEAHRLLPLDAETYQHHWFHGEDRDWPETNCYVDLWVELLHALGLDPIASLAFTLSVDFDGEQWEFFKPPLENLRELYGLNVREINVWRPLPEHIIGQLERGNLLTFETDAFHLPDTAGVSYGIGHQKTTIVAQFIDVAAQRMGYFHNRSYHELGPNDFAAALRLNDTAGLPPYTELIDLAQLTRLDASELRMVASNQAVEHLSRRASGDPVAELAARINDDLPWLRANPDLFHDYAFGTLRQLGAWAATAATFVRWLDQPELADAATAFDSISDASKTCQFKLARAVAGRDANLSELFTRMSECHLAAYSLLVSAYGV